MCVFFFLVSSVGKERITRLQDIRCQYAVHMSCVGMLCYVFFWFVCIFPLVQGKMETSAVLVVDELGGKQNLQGVSGWSLKQIGVEADAV